MSKITATTDALPVACFAPPLSDELLASYSALIAALPASPVKDAMGELWACVKLWWELPESKRSDVTRFNILHRGKQTTFAVVPMEEAHVQSLYEFTPWMYECLAIEAMLEHELPIGANDSVRNAAFHLLWHAKEITQDREPLTQDKLPE